MQGFTPFSALAGGALIGVAASLLMLWNGRIAGVSSLFAGAVDPRAEDRGAGVWFIGGLFLAGVLARIFHPSSLPSVTPSLAIGAIAGLLVGVGTRLGSGCTSGHGVCGLSRLSKRSLVATLTFMGTAMITVGVIRVLGGAS